MNIQVIPTVSEARTEDLGHRIAIVVDVLRATSTMLAALAAGAEAVIPAETVQQARQLQQRGYLLGGERSCRKIPGFDLGNSPLEYTAEAVRGRTVVMTTANGTRAIQKAGKASRVLIGSLLNGRACAAKAASFGEDIAILCAGTQDVFALEDGLCAGMLVDELIRLGGGREDGIEMNDFGWSMLYAYRQAKERLSEALLSSANGRRLAKLGFRDDILYSARTNVLELAPDMSGGQLSLAAAQI